MPDNLYDDLGVPKDASPDDIKRAYRKRAKQDHPDAGGDAERFAKVGRAYMVLSDPERRKRYDETGHTEPKRDDTLEKIASIIAGKLASIMGNERFDWRTRDLGRAIIKEINRDIAEKQAQIAAGRLELKDARELRRRFTYKGNKTDVIDGILGQRVQGLEHAIDGLKRRVQGLEDARTYVDDYGYQVDQSEQPADAAFIWVEVESSPGRAP